MPRKPVDATRGLVPMIRNPVTNRYVRVNSKIGRSIMSQYEPKQEMQEEKAEKMEVMKPKRVKKPHVEFKNTMEEPKSVKHPVEIDEIARQLELLKQRLYPAGVPDPMDI